VKAEDLAIKSKISPLDHGMDPFGPHFSALGVNLPVRFKMVLA
jgi:hypothetical protein